MATTPLPTIYHSISAEITESGPSIPPGIHTPSHHNSAESVLPVVHYLYLHVKAEGDYPLPPVLFNCEVILEMCLSSTGDAPWEVLVYSNTEAILEYGESADPDLIAS